MREILDPTPGSELVWHDTECGSYGADLELWARLAADAGPAAETLDLGAGSGRVALHLAARGWRVTAVDNNPELLAALRARAEQRGLSAPEVRTADLRTLALGRRFELAIAPMQLFHLLDGPAERSAALRAIARHLTPGGHLYAALLDDTEPLSSGTPDPLPDVRELDGWVHSSLPLTVLATGDVVEIARLRQLVSPAGDLDERRVTVRLQAIGIGAFEAEARACGFSVLPRIPLAATEDHVGSVVVCLEAPR